MTLRLEATRTLWKQTRLFLRYEHERAVETLPRLVAKPDDRKRLLALLDRVVHDERIQGMKPTLEQVEMAGRITQLLQAAPAKVIAHRKEGRRGTQAREV